MVTQDELNEHLRRNYPGAIPPATVGGTASPQTPPAMPGVPTGVVEIANTVSNFMPIIEQVTGLSRKEIFGALLKGSLKGNTLEGLLGILTGAQQKQEPKIAIYIKNVAIWGAAGFGIVMLFFVLAIILLKVANVMLGAL